MNVVKEFGDKETGRQGDKRQDDKQFLVRSSQSPIRHIAISNS
jgi:hypothetical protein